MRWATLCVMLSAATEMFASSPSDMDTAFARSAQLIVVSAPKSKANRGTLVLFERTSDRSWRRVGRKVAVMLGRNGLKGGSKREGDGCSPAGVFELERIYGSDEQLAGGSRNARFPRQRLTSTTEGIDDPQSRFYNRIVDAARVPAQQRDWKSSEKLGLGNPMFRWLVEVRYNWDQVPGLGSCIYLHIWKAPGVPTSGCTAMSERDLERIVRWLDASKRPLLVQVPETELNTLKLPRSQRGL